MNVSSGFRVRSSVLGSVFIISGFGTEPGTEGRTQNAEPNREREHGRRREKAEA
jgi:hypothetical protein